MRGGILVGTALLLFAAPLPAEESPSPRLVLSFLGVAGQSFTLGADHGFAELGGPVIEAGRLLPGWRVIALDLCPMLISQPLTNSGAGRRSVYAVSLSLLLRQYFASAGSHVHPFVEIGGGPFDALHRVPAAGSRLNFFGQAGLGLEVPLGPGWRGVAGYRFIHVSNGGFGPHNPSWNFNALALGGRLLLP